MTDAQREAGVWPEPWNYDPQGYMNGPCVKDAGGQVICAFFWPVHDDRDTAHVEDVVAVLGQMVAELGKA